MKDKNKITSNTQKGKNQKKFRFNFIDFLVILTVLLLCAIALSFFSPASVFDKLSKKNEVTIQYTVELLGVDEDFIEKIKEENTVVDSVSKNSLGKVKAVDASTPHSVLLYDQTSDAGVLSQYPDKYNVLVTIETVCDYAQTEGYSVNGKRIAVGENMSLRFPDYTGEGYCISISVAG